MGINIFGAISYDYILVLLFSFVSLWIWGYLRTCRGGLCGLGFLGMMLGPKGSASLERSECCSKQEYLYVGVELLFA